MLPIYSRAVSGMQASQKLLDITANNIANVDTMGFNASDPTITDLAYQITDARELVGASAATSVGVGTHVEGTPRTTQPGSPVITGNPLDTVITGGGFFQVQLPDGSAAYTRQGAMRIDAQGRFNIDGNFIVPAITVPSSASNVSIAANGQVTASLASGPTILGQLQLARFPNEQGIQAIGNTLYTATVASGTPIIGLPSQVGFGGILAGALEAAHVDIGREMARLIVGERSFQFNSKALQTADSMLGDITHH